MTPDLLPLESPVLLTANHDLGGFDCGVPALNDFLRKYAWVNQQAGAARTYVSARGGRVVGYYSLAAGSVRPEEAPVRVKKGLARHPIPVILLARLAVDLTERGRGLGAALLADALRRAAAAADIIGCRAVLVHAKDDAAQAFYRKFGFEPSPTDEFQLALLLKDVKASLKPA